VNLVMLAIGVEIRRILLVMGRVLKLNTIESREVATYQAL
jgi:hypothetical protein